MSSRFSLICGTAGRVHELQRLLRSLSDQSCQDFELLLIDQNSDDRAVKIIESLSRPVNVKRISTSPGLCKALNLGLQNARGEIVGFPDDDCWYATDLLERISSLFYEHKEWDGITMPAADENGVPSIARWAKQPGRLTPSNLGLRGCSTTVFYRRPVCTRIGAFDESIGGEGSLLSPGSDIDYLHRVVAAGFHVSYQPQLVVSHPQTLPVAAADQAGRDKRYKYAYGEGAITRRYSLPLWYRFVLTAFPLMRAAKNRIFGKREAATLEWLTFRGRLDGWMRTRPMN